MEIIKKILKMHYIGTLDPSRVKYKFWNNLYNARLYDYRLQIIKANVRLYYVNEDVVVINCD